MALFFSQSKHHGLGEAEVPLAGRLSPECLELEGMKPPEIFHSSCRPQEHFSHLTPGKILMEASPSEPEEL